jgi:gamma-glutamylaminecyclotransferase
MNTNLLFTYGTLMRGFCNHRLLAGSKFLGHAKTEDSFILYDLGFPGMADEESQTQVAGELFRIDDDTLARCDRLEGVPHLYRREQITVLCGCESATCYAYFIQPPHYNNAKIIHYGNWAAIQPIKYHA